MNDQDVLMAIHDLNASRYQLEVAMGMLAKVQVPNEIHILHKSIMEKITNAHSILIRDMPKAKDGSKGI